MSARGRPTKANKASRTEQARASRLRLYRDAGKRLDASDVAWLTKYEREHPYRHRGRAAPARAEPNSRTTPKKIERDVVAGDVVEPRAPEPAQESPRYEIDMTELAPRSEPVDEKPTNGEHAASSCPFGDKCPHCRDGVPKRNNVLGKCGTTGRVVYEPMDEKGARFVGGFVLNGMAVAARILRPDHALIEPDDEDYEDMSNAVRMTIDRRMPQLTVWSDLMALGFAFSAFGRRALFDPPPLPARKLERGDR